MDSSRRAVESYWRSRMIDGATSDEDKVTPVYKLEEICDLLRSSHSSIVKEVSGFILKRLGHKSPIVKHKGLRVIKYAVGKSGVEFRREMQRNSVAVRQLIHYKGQLDPLKGDALNKAVRATAQEALSAIFSAEENNQTTTAAAAPAEHLTKRIQGFGNTNYEPPSSDDKKSFLSEVVGIGSATIKQGLNSLTQSPSLKKNNDTGSYRSPNLRSSLTTEIDQSDRYEGYEHYTETQPPTRLSSSSTAGTWGQNFGNANTESSNGNSSSSYSSNKNNNSREERLLETIVTSGGVRLQPTRDALQVFLREVPKLDALALSHALESKLQSHLWQVRVKAVCILEAILRKKDEENLAIVAAYFSENIDVVVKCSESPQASLREKANKVLSLLNPGEGSGGVMTVNAEKTTSDVNVVQLPDLIDTGDSDDLYHDGGANQSTNSSPLIDDLFGGGGDNSNEQKNDDNDPFADVSFHTNNDKQQHQQHPLSATDPFTGLTVDDKPGGANKNGPQIFDDIFGSTSEPLAPPPPVEEHKGVYSSTDINDLMGGMSINKPNDSSIKLQTSSDVFGVMQPPPPAASVFPMGYNLPSGIMLNSAFPSQPLTNYGAMGNIFAQQQLQIQQQQLLASMSNFQQLGNFHSHNATAVTALPSHYSTAGGIQATPASGGYVSALPDIFNPTIPAQAPTMMMNNSKKEDTKAFDFISDHLASARDPKRVV